MQCDTEGGDHLCLHIVHCLAQLDPSLLYDGDDEKEEEDGNDNDGDGESDTTTCV